MAGTEFIYHLSWLCTMLLL